MPTIGLNHYNLRAAPELLAELKEFYCEVVGLELGKRMPAMSSGYWLYAGGQDILHLSEAKQGEIRLTHVASTFDHVALTCTQRSEIESRLKSYGIQFKTSHTPLIGKVQVFFQDPAGNGVELNFSDE